MREREREKFTIDRLRTELPAWYDLLKGGGSPKFSDAAFLASGTKRGISGRRREKCGNVSGINEAPFSYRNRTPHLYIYIYCYGSSNGYQGHINIGSSALDWPDTVQNHADTSTILEKYDRLINKKGMNTGVFASKYNFDINNFRCETAAVNIASSSKRKSA